MFRMRGLTPEDAADLAQEAAARAILHLRRRGQDGDELDPLLNRIARNLLIDRARSAAPRLVSLDDAEELGDAGDDPSEEVSRRQVRRAVRHAIGELPPRHRTAITFSLSGLTPAQVAERMGIRRNAADALLHRARRSLAERLRGTGHDMLGAIGVLGLKIRVASRRLVDQLRALEPLSATVLNAVATVALVSTMAIAAPASANPSGSAPGRGPAGDRLTGAIEEVVGSASSVSAPDGPQSRVKANGLSAGYSSNDQRFRANTPLPGRGNRLWADLWREGDGARPGLGSQAGDAAAVWLEIWEEESGEGSSLTD